MQLINEFTVDAPLDVAWAVLTDVPRVVACIPGAELDGQDGDDFQARVTVKVGPVGLTLSGTATIVRRDDTTHEMVVRGTARDRKGNGSAEAGVTMSARGNGERTEVTIRTDVELGGRIAQFGTGVITQVSNRIIGQFVRRLNAEITSTTGDFSHPSVQSGATVPRRQSGIDWVAVAVTALAGVALGLAIGRTLR